MTNDDNLQGNPYAEMAEHCLVELTAERDSESPRKSEVAFLLGTLQANATIAAAWETRQLRRVLESDRDAVKVDPSEGEESATLEDLTRPQSDAATPAKELNPGDIVLVPMVVQPLKAADVVLFKPMDPRFVLEQDQAWVFRKLASPVVFHRSVKGPAQ